MIAAAAHYCAEAGRATLDLDVRAAWPIAAPLGPSAGKPADGQAAARR
jgi:hypothetical protein